MVSAAAAAALKSLFSFWEKLPFEFVFANFQVDFSIQVFEFEQVFLE